MTPIQQIKAALPFDQYAARHLKFKHGFAVCPFHKEKTGSLKANKLRGKCFGCGWSGDIISFAASYHGISTSAAIRMLADELGIALTKQAPIKPYDAIKAKRERSEAEEWYRQCRRTLIASMLADDYDRVLPFLTALEAAHPIAAYREQRTVEQAALLRAAIRESDLWVKAMTPIMERLISQ